MRVKHLAMSRARLTFIRRKPLILYITTVSAEDTHVAGRNVPRRVNRPLKQTVTNATNPTRRCSTSWLSSTTQPSKPHSEAQGQHLPRYIQQEFNDLSNVAVWSMGAMRVRCEGLSSRASGRLQLANDAALPQLRCSAGWLPRKCGAADRRSLPSRSPPPVVLSFPFQLRFCWLAIPS